jgi:hypothetical protein
MQYSAVAVSKDSPVHAVPVVRALEGGRWEGSRPWQDTKPPGQRPTGNVDVGTLMRLKDRDAGLGSKAEWKPPRAGKPALSIGGGRRGAAGGQVRMRARPRARAPPSSVPGARLTWAGACLVALCHLPDRGHQLAASVTGNYKSSDS